MPHDVKAHDDDGRELTPAPYVLICPAEHVADARQMAADHLRDAESLVEAVEGMLPTPLSPSGVLPATHFACARFVHHPTIKLIAGSLAHHAESFPWVGAVFHADHPPEIIKSLFCCVLGVKADILPRLDLREIT